MTIRANPERDQSFSINCDQGRTTTSPNNRYQSQSHVWYSRRNCKQPSISPCCYSVPSISGSRSTAPTAVNRRRDCFSVPIRLQRVLQQAVQQASSLCRTVIIRRGNEGLLRKAPGPLVVRPHERGRRTIIKGPQNLLLVTELIHCPALRPFRQTVETEQRTGLDRILAEIGTTEMPTEICAAI